MDFYSLSQRMALFFARHNVVVDGHFHLGNGCCSSARLDLDLIFSKPAARDELVNMIAQAIAPKWFDVVVTPAEKAIAEFGQQLARRLTDHRGRPVAWLTLPEADVPPKPLEDLGILGGKTVLLNALWTDGKVFEHQLEVLSTLLALHLTDALVLCAHHHQPGEIFASGSGFFEAKVLHNFNLNYWEPGTENPCPHCAGGTLFANAL